jgi:hypothetical protein
VKRSAVWQHGTTAHALEMQVRLLPGLPDIRLQFPPMQLQDSSFPADSKYHVKLCSASLTTDEPR